MATQTVARQVVTGHLDGPPFASALRTGPDGMAAFVFPLSEVRPGLAPRSGFAIALPVCSRSANSAWSGDAALRMKFGLVVGLGQFWPQLANAVAYHLVDDILAVHKAPGRIDAALAAGDLRVIARFLRLAALHSDATNCPDERVDCRSAHC